MTGRAPSEGPVPPVRPGPPVRPAPPGPAARFLRSFAYAVFPCAVLLAGCAVADVPLPGTPLSGTGALVLVLALLLAEVLLHLRLRRHGAGRRAALGELVPEAVLRLAEHGLRLAEHGLRLAAGLVRWAARRPHGVAGADGVFPYARDQAALLYGLAFVAVVETAGMAYLLAGLPLVHGVVLVLDVSTVLFVLGPHAASVTRPHTLAGGVLRLRQAAHVDVGVPLERIASVRHAPLFSHERADGELNLVVGGRTSVTIELTEPVEVPRLFGAPRPVRVLRVHADDPGALYGAVSGALTRARTAPSPSPGPPRSV